MQLRYSSSLPPVLAPLLGAALLKRAKLRKSSRKQALYFLIARHWTDPTRVLSILFCSNQFGLSSSATNSSRLRTFSISVIAGVKFTAQGAVRLSAREIDCLPISGQRCRATAPKLRVPSPSRFQNSTKCSHPTCSGPQHHSCLSPVFSPVCHETSQQSCDARH